MFKKIARWFRNLFYVNYEEKPVNSVPVEVAQGMGNEVVFDEETLVNPLTINAQVHGGTLKQRDWMRNVLSVMRHVVISDFFRDAVLDRAFTYSDQDPLTIYKNFMSGKDLYEAMPDGEMDVDVTMYYKRNGTIGYTYPNTPKTWMNMRHFDTREYENIAKAVGNIVHEYMHNLGYKHPHRWTKTREDSVPYAYGYIARDMALEFLGSGRDLPRYNEAVDVSFN